MKNKKQTAVEWLVSALQENEYIFFDGKSHDYSLIELIAEAKELEKQQHEETWYGSTLQFDNAAQMTNKKLFEDYYTETYGGDNE